MKKYRNLIIISFVFLFQSVNVNGQTFDIDAVKLEIQEAAYSEETAFKSGNCEKVLDLMAEDITFLANGRKVPSKQMIGKFCNSLPRPFKTATVDELAIYPITENSGYVIRRLEYPLDEKTKISEYVTKIWKKTNGKWKITHLHSTVKEVPISG